MSLADELRADADKVIQFHLERANKEKEKMHAMQEEAKKLASQFLDEDIINCINKCKSAAKSGSLMIGLHNEKEDNLCGNPDYHSLNEDLVYSVLCEKGIKIERRYVKAACVYDGPGSHGAYTCLMASWG